MDESKIQLPFLGLRHWTNGVASNGNPTEVVKETVDLGVPAVIGETALFVLRVDFGQDGANHLASCWVNPAPGSLGAVSAPPPNLTLAIEDPGFYFDAFNWHPSSGPDGASLDEFRIGKSWAAITPSIHPLGTLLILQ